MITQRIQVAGYHSILQSICRTTGRYQSIVPISQHHPSAMRLASRTTNRYQSATAENQHHPSAMRPTSRTTRRYRLPSRRTPHTTPRRATGKSHNSQIPTSYAGISPPIPQPCDPSIAPQPGTIQPANPTRNASHPSNRYTQQPAAPTAPTPPATRRNVNTG